MTPLYVNIVYFDHIHPVALSTPFLLLLIIFLFQDRLPCTSVSFPFNDPVCFIKVAYKSMDDGLLENDANFPVATPL